MTLAKFLIIMVLIWIVTISVIMFAFAVPFNERSACFSDLNEYFKFRLENDNKTDYTVIFPCPELDLKTIPKDESNK